MAAVEVWTVGGGEYIVNVFNAVAAWTGQGGYKSMLQVVMVMGFAMATLTIAFDSDWRAWINWFLQATLMYMCLMVPRVDVQVVDRVNPSLAPSYVANVPLGLGLMASFTSQVGDYLTTSAEVVFGLPNDLNYSANGMVYGARLLQATQAIQFNDAEFATNLDEHMRNCVFYDVLLGRKSMATLAAAPDLWATLGPGSPARAQKYLVRNGDSTVSSTIITCQAAYTNMTAELSSPGGPLDQVMLPLSRSLYPKLLPSIAKAKLLADLGGSYTYLSGVSATASDILKQNLMINAMTQAMHSMAATGGGSSVDVYAETRAEIQTRNTYSSIAQAAMKWVPLLHIVLTVMFYALFPVIFPLFLIPRTGVPALKGYVTGFFYLAAWGPLFVILHMMLMFKGSADLSAVANGTGTTLFSFAGISGVSDDIALLAGYLIASVPFIAGGVAKGAMAISSNATSFLAPSQNAAEVAANEASTGNISAGNTTLDNFSGNNRQSNNWGSAGSYTAGASVFNSRQNDGTLTSSYPESTVVDASGAISRLPVSPTLTQELQSAFTTSASSARSRSETLSNTAASSYATANVQSSEFRKALSSGATLERSYGSNDQQTISSGLNAQSQLAQKLHTETGMSLSEAEGYSAELFATGQAEIRAGTPLGGLVGSNAGVSGAVGGRANSSRSGDARASYNVGKAQDILTTYARTNNLNEQRENFDRAVHNTSDSSITSKADSVNASYTRAASVSQEARTSYDQSQRFEKAASLRDSSGVSVAENASQRFVNYVLAEQGKLSAMGIQTSWNPTRGQAVTPDQVSEQSFYVRKFVEAENARVASGVEPSLVEPSPAGIVRPTGNTQSKIQNMGEEGIAAMHSRGLPAAPGGTSAGDLNKRRTNFDANYAEGRRDVGGIVDVGEKELEPVGRGLSSDPKETLRRSGSHWMTGRALNSVNDAIDSLAPTPKR